MSEKTAHHDRPSSNFLADGRPYLTTRQAALYVGYEPGEGPLSADPQIRCFYAWALSRGIKQQPGRAVYRRADLDAAIRGTPMETPELARMRQLARQDIAARRRRTRIAVTVRRALTTE